MNRWENSLYYRRTFAPFLQTAVPLVARLDITASQMLAAGSTPLNLFLGNTGYTYYLQQGVFFKGAGPAFTFGGVGDLRIQYASTPGVAIAAFSIFAGWLDQLTETPTIFSLNIPGNTKIATEAAANIGGKGIQLTTNNGANLGGTGAPCTLLLTYFIIPTIISNIGGPVTPLP